MIYVCLEPFFFVTFCSKWPKNNFPQLYANAFRIILAVLDAEIFRFLRCSWRVKPCSASCLTHFQGGKFFKKSPWQSVYFPIYCFMSCLTCFSGSNFFSKKAVGSPSFFVCCFKSYLTYFFGSYFFEVNPWQSKYFLVLIYIFYNLLLKHQFF